LWLLNTVGANDLAPQSIVAYHQGTSFEY